MKNRFKGPGLHHQRPLTEVTAVCMGRWRNRKLWDPRVNSVMAQTQKEDKGRYPPGCRKMEGCPLSPVRTPEWLVNWRMNGKLTLHNQQALWHFLNSWPWHLLIKCDLRAWPGHFPDLLDQHLHLGRPPGDAQAHWPFWKTLAEKGFREIEGLACAEFPDVAFAGIELGQITFLSECSHPHHGDHIANLTESFWDGNVVSRVKHWAYYWSKSWCSRK